MMKVLIVEDRPEIARIIEEYLRPFTSAIVKTMTRTEAAEIIRSTAHLDLVTIDLGLPDSGVKETMEWLKEVRELRPNAVVIVISGIVSKEEEAAVLAAGADGFIHKMEMASGASTFIERVAQIWNSLFANPKGYERHLPIAEAAAERFATYMKAQQ